MLAAIRLSLSFLTPAERTKYFALVAVRALTGLLDVFGIALIAFITGIAASQLDPETAGPIVIAGITLPVIDTLGLLLLVIFVLGVFLLKAVIAISLLRAQAHFIAGVEIRNSTVVAEFLLMGSLSSAKRYSKAEFQYAITNSTTYAFTGLLNNVANLTAEGFLLLVITATFLFVNPVVALFTLLYFGLVVVVIQGIIGRRLKKAGRDAVDGTVATNNAISDTLDTFREISVLHKQALFISRISGSRAKVARSDASMTFLSGMPRYVIETALILGVVILVSQQLFSNQLATGLVSIGVFLAGGVRMMASLLPLQSAVSNLRNSVEQSATSLALLEEHREAERSVAESTDDRVARPAGIGGLRVELEEVRFRYHDSDSDTIHDVSITIEEGSYVAVIGPSGAGKTTIVDLVLGLVHPSAGSVTIAGVDPTKLRRRFPGIVSYVPQKPGLVSGTIADNIALGVPAENVDRELLREVVDAAHLREFIDTLPDGMETSVGKQVDSLSGGQIQRIGVARALYSRPRLLILDEATSGLDAGSESFISSTLRSLHGTVTVVVIAHRLSTVQHADLVYVIENGAVTASGDFKTVQKAAPVVAEYVKLMSFDSDPEPVDG